MKRHRKTAKRSCTVLLAIAFVSLFVFSAAQAVFAMLIHDERVCKIGGDNYKFEVTAVSETRTVTLKEYEGSTANLTIPSSVLLDDGYYDVTAIAPRVFEGNLLLKSVVIPDTVTQISDYAFADCINATGITFGSGVESIGQKAFYNFGANNGSAGELNLPDSLKSTDDFAFKGTAFGGALVLPDSLTTMGVGTFCNCAGFTSVQFGSGLKSIAEQGFYGCTGLAGNITVSQTVESIGNSAFCGCTGITGVTMQNGVKTIGDKAFSKCTSMTDVDIPASVTYFGKKAFENTALVSPHLADGLAAIGENAFQNCKSITGVTVPGSVRTIGAFAFDGCSNLETVNFNKGLETVGNCAFQSCEKLQSAAIPDTVTSIGTYAFSNCIKMTSLTISNGVTIISIAAFQQCEGLQSLTLPNTVKTIESLAFSDCKGILQPVVIPDSVTSIGDYAFKNCKNMPSVTFGKNVKTVGVGAFYGCGEIASLALPDGITSVASSAFDGCTNLSGRLILPASLKTAGVSAFGNRCFNEIINKSDSVFDINCFASAADSSGYDYADSNGVKAKSIGKGTYSLKNKFAQYVKVPTGKTFTYNGKLQTGVKSGEGYTLGGTKAATNAGSYKATAILKSGYVWTDGTKTSKTIRWKINKTIVKVALPKGRNLTYYGKQQTGVKSGGKYTVYGTSKSANAGSYTAKVKLRTNANVTYVWTDGSTAAKSIKWKIDKAPNRLAVKAKTKKLSCSSLKKKSLAVARKDLITVSGAKGKVTYAKVSGNRAFTVNRKTGRVTVKKGTAKGEYTVKIKVTAAGDKNYKKSSKTVAVKIVIKQ
ncbi:MAG: leucine-rich repeat protein [Eubacterium sp.]|nr:leucine-rich repeat protein [Eubacterium sp.]